MANAAEAFQKFISLNQEKEEEDIYSLPMNLRKDYNEVLNAKPQVRVIPQESLEEYNQILTPEEGTHRTSLGVEYTLNDLEKDPVFQSRASRFMQEIESNDDIFEYLRDSEYSLTQAIARSMKMREWSPEAKADYTYLRQTFDKASMGGFKQTLNMVKDVAVDFVTDPFNWVVMATGGAAFGATVAGKELIKIGTKQALSKIQKAALKKELLEQSKKGMLYGSLEGGAWAGAHDYFLQQGDVELGLRDSVDATQIAVTTAIGSTLGAVLGTSIGLMTSTSPLLASKIRRFANEDVIESTTKRKGKTPKEQQKTLGDEVEGDADLDELKNTTVWLPKWLKGLSESFGKTTTQFMKAGKQFEKLGTHLRKYRYDALKTILDPEGGITLGNWTFGENLVNKKGLWHTNFLRALQPLPRTGKKMIWGKERNTFWTNRLPDRENVQLYYLIQNRDTPKWKARIMPDYYPAFAGTPISSKTRQAAKEISDVLDAVWEESSRKPNHKWVGPRNKRRQVVDKSLNEDWFEPLSPTDPRKKRKNYFPWKYSHEKIAADPDGFVQRVLIDHGWESVDEVTGKVTVVPYARPNNTVSSKSKMSILTDEGELIHGFGTDVEGKLKPLIVDQVAFGRDFMKEAVQELGEDASEAEILHVATWLKGRAMRDKLLLYKENPRQLWELNEAISDMLEPYNLKTKGPIRGAGRTGWLGERVWDNVPDHVMFDYVDTNVEEVISDYINNAALLVTREQIFGKSAEVYASRYLTPIMKELEEGGVSAKERHEIERRLTKNYRRITGIEIPTPFGDDPTGRVRWFTDVMKTMQTMAHLPLATVSSLTEPLILLSRVQGKSAPRVMVDIVGSLGKEAQKMKQKIVNAGKRQFGKEHAGLDDVLDETWQEVYKVGLALEQAVYDRMEGLYGEMVNTRLQKINRAFFKTTLLTQWTAAVQLAGFTTGKRMIRQNLKQLVDDVDVFGRPLSKVRKERLIGELHELNIDEKRGMKWFKNSLDEKGEFNTMTAKRFGFYENDFLRGANRFSREIILVPDITEANKPLWFSHPVGQLFAQFASYPTAFNNTILKRFAYEITRDVKGIKHGAMPVATPKIIATTMLMTSVATLTNIARSKGTSLEKPPGLQIADAVERWGGMGPFQHGYRFWENAKFGSGPLAASAKSVSGPLIQDIIDTALYRRGIFENLAANVPFYQLGTALTPEAMKELKRAGRSVDKALFAPFARPTKSKASKSKSLALYKSPIAYAEGGPVVTLDKLRIPDKDRMTGLPYHMQAGVLWQGKEQGGEKGRKELARGGEVNGGVDDEAIKEVYSLVSKDIRKLAPIFKDLEEIDIYTEDELKGYAKGITEPVYRIMKDNTSQQDAEDIRDAESIGVHVATEKPSTTTGIVLKGYVRLVRPLNLSGMEVPLEGFNFVEEIQSNPELKDKIINDSILPNPTAKAHVDDLLFYHSLNKEAVKNHKDLPHMDQILNVVASHKIREVFTDIGYDGIIYEGEDSDVIDQQVKELEREPKFAGGIISKLARRALLKKKTKKAIVFNKDQGKYEQVELPLNHLENLDYQKRLKIKSDPRTLYVFADNETRGATKDIAGSSATRGRGLDNTIGIRTKRKPGNKPQDFWNDYKVTRKGKPDTVNSKAILRHRKKINDDITAVMKKFIEGDYDGIIFSEELLALKDFRRTQTSMSRQIFKNKLTRLRKYTKDFQDNGRLLGEGKLLSRRAILERDIAQVYDPKWVPPDKIIDPTGKTAIQKSKLGIEKPLDKPRGATARDLGLPEDEALYAKGHIDSIKRDMAYDDADEKIFIEIQEDVALDTELSEDMWDSYLFNKYPELFRTKKSEGGRIGFEEGGDTRDPTEWDELPWDRDPQMDPYRYGSEGADDWSAWMDIQIARDEATDDERPLTAEELQKDYEEKQKEAERLTQLWLDKLADEKQKKQDEATLWADYIPKTLEQEPEQAEYDEWLRNSILDEATGKRYSPEEFRKMVTSREANKLKRRIRRGKRRIEREKEKEKREQEFSGGLVSALERRSVN